MLKSNRILYSLKVSLQNMLIDIKEWKLSLKKNDRYNLKQMIKFNFSDNETDW